jgi:hypothetical protein
LAVSEGEGIGDPAGGGALAYGRNLGVEILDRF